MRLQGTFDLSCGTPHERYDRTFIARRTHRNGEPSFRAYQHNYLTLVGTTKYGNRCNSLNISLL